MRSAKIVLLLACKWLGLFRLARHYTRHRLRILCYHGFELADETGFRPKLFIKAATFERRLRTLRRTGCAVIALDDAVERLSRGTLPPNAVAITFDDGFYGLYAIGFPLLKRAGYPATLYATTYYMQHPEPIFRLAVQYIFWKTTRSRMDVGTLLGGTEEIVDLAAAARAQACMWRIIDAGERFDSERQRQELCEALGARLAVPYADMVRSRILSLVNPTELRVLADGLVSIELHTHRHRFPADDRATAQAEIADNRAALARWLPGKGRSHFCYPSGLWEPQQWPWLEELGVHTATTCLPGLNDIATPRHALRRFLDGENIHQLEFEAAVSGFSELMRRMVPAA
jgi:peptidoglycan/xylan/chitin deacetylase (PgdA/CDA1 family)